MPRIAEVAPEVVDTFASGRLLIGGLSSFALFGIGWVLFGIASLRARVFPAAVSTAILAGGLLSGIPIGVVYLSGGVILGLAIVSLGAWMMRPTTKTSAAGEPAATDLRTNLHGQASAHRAPDRQSSGQFPIAPP